MLPERQDASSMKAAANSKIIPINETFYLLKTYEYTS